MRISEAAGTVGRPGRAARAARKGGGIADNVLAAYIEERTVEPVRTRRSRYGRAA
ncbi:hypothetical protein [Streptomyces melanogenes]|uniref:Transposase n=1 Tax=Streptomyces melanogenes TaxID=67326 RepID=A0ABZ1XKS5_9ACTN|nr:hypothetical protein [Streptomyces melanogenes]